MTKDGGKTALGCYWQLKMRLKYPNTRGLIGRAVLKTLKETTLVSFFQVAKLQGLDAGKHYKYNSQSSTNSNASNHQLEVVTDYNQIYHQSIFLYS